LPTFLGLDIGTSAVKAVLVAAEAAGAAGVGETPAGEAVLAEAEAPLSLDRPRPGWAEQDPEAWWRAAIAVLARLRAAAPAAYAAIGGIGLSGQMHALVALGPDDAPLRPAILWNDARATVEAHRLNETVPGLAQRCGVPAMASFTAPKLLWLAAHEPEAFRRIGRILLPKDYVRLKLAGEAATDMCDAAGTLMLDEAARDWDGPAVAATGLARRALPRLVEGSAPSGRLRPAVAAELGLPPGVVVAGGAGDAAAGAIGIGAAGEGDAFVSLGTSCQLFVSGTAYRPYPEALVHAFAHGLPGRWFQMAALLNGASALAWIADVLGVGTGGIDGLLDRVAARGLPVSPVTFLPYLAGERTPHDDPNARGVLVGLDPSTTAEDLVQAVIEGVALSLVDADDALAAAGVRPERLAAVGGGSRSRLWMEIAASALGRPISLYEGGAKGPAFGAARLARLAVTGEAVGAVCRPPPIAAIVAPSPARAEALAERLPRFRALYAALKPLF